MVEPLAVSCVIPVYNGEKYLAAAIESVLNQTRPPEQLIVVDDGSTDGTAEVARSYATRIEYVYRENGGIAAARNTGVRLAQEDWLSFLDADDLWTPHKLERQLAAVNESPTASVLFGFVQQFLCPEAVTDDLTVPEGMMPGYVAGTMLARRHVFDTVGLFDESRTLGEFIDWFARLRESDEVCVMLNDVLLLRRIHGENTGVLQSDHRNDYVHILKAALDRRRR